MVVEALLERPPAEPKPSDTDVYTESGALALAICEEFGADSVINPSVTIVERNLVSDDGAFKYFNLRSSEDGWKFDFIFTGGGKPVETGGTPGGHVGKDADRPWANPDILRELGQEAVQQLVDGMQVLHTELAQA